MPDIASGLSHLAMPALYAVTFLMALVSGIIPFVINIEIYLIGVAALSRAPAAVIISMAVAGQMVAKYLLYLVGNGVLTLRFIRWQRRDAAAKVFEKYRRHSFAVVGFSAVTGFPPFYGISLMAGAVRLPLVPFLTVGTLGRTLRFTLIYLAPA